MTNDGWGKLPTNNDGWGKVADTWPAPAQDASIFVPATESAPEVWGRTNSNIEWLQVGPFAPGTASPTIDEKWPAIQAADWTQPAMLDWPNNKTGLEAEAGAAPEARWTDEDWTADALSGASNRASVINSLRGVKDQYTIDQDGELSNIKETLAKPSDRETGVYIAYSDGKWLHAILSGPYATRDEADKWADVAFELLTNDGAFRLAFENNFDRDGIYYAEIPLSAKRHGAYGVLS